MADLVSPSERLSLFLTDGRNIAIFFLSATVLILSTLLVVDLYVRVHTPPPYELQADAVRYREQQRMTVDQALQELRNRMNVERASQASTNLAFDSQMDALRSQIDQLSGVSVRQGNHIGRR